jgi:2',3'-cyclic-nucleotide 2'-phosphodiesterase/3'-nucleotidase
MKLYTSFILLLAATSGYARTIKKCVRKDLNFTYKQSGDIVMSEPTDEDSITIAVAATSDMHGRIYPWEYAIDEADDDAGFALTDTIVTKLRADYPNTILLDIGDSMQDNSAELFVKYDTHPIVKALNLIKYDAWIPGNHEFNYGLSFLERNFKHFNGRVICSNIVKSDTKKYYVLPYQIYKVKGVRVAVVGAIAPHIKQWEASNPDHYKNLDFLDPIESLKKTIKAIEGQYDVLIGALHISRNGEYDAEGKTGAFQIAEAIPEFDAIIAGHEHATYCEKIGDTWVLEPGRYGSHVAFTKFDMKKNEKGEWKIAKVEAKNIETKGVEPSERIMKAFKKVHNICLANANEIVGKVSEDFVEGVDYITGKDDVTTMPRAQIEDTALMDLINEVQMYYTKAEISAAALFNNNQNLKAGDFKRKDVAFIYKYDNSLMGVNMKGENLLKYMEWCAGYYQTSKEGDVTIAFNPEFRAYNYDMFSGIHYEIDVSEEEGKRIKNATLNGKKIEADATYKVAVNNYRFGTLTSYNWATEADVYYTSVNEAKPSVRDLIIKYTQEVLSGTLSPSCDNNWKIVGLPSSFNDPATIEQIKSGKITIPTSSDGRTPNTEPVKKI